MSRAAISRSLRALRLLALCGLMLQASASWAALQYNGVNLSGAEFGQTTIYGTYGTHYTYPNVGSNPNEIGYFTSKGMNTFRLPFRWERTQRTLGGALDAADLARMNEFVNEATAAGAYTILEPHNFARYFPPPGGSDYQTSTTRVIGGSLGPTNAQFADFWSRMANQYKTNDKVIFNLMNEPANMDTDVWFGAATAAIQAIRATGATNTIMVPGNRYTGAWTWLNSGGGSGTGRSNAAAMEDLLEVIAADPATYGPMSGYMVEVHQYFDNDGSGTGLLIGTNGNPDNPNIGVERLTAMTNWLHQMNGLGYDIKGYLGELAIPNVSIGNGTYNISGQPHPQIGDEFLDTTMEYLTAHSDVWAGWNWWGGGPWWGNYMFALDPTNLGQGNQGPDRPALVELEPYMNPGDLNDDGVVDSLDIDHLWNKIRNGVEDPGNNDNEDFNDDNFINEDDVDFMLRAMFPDKPNLLYGDADLDGGVGGLDYTAWRLRTGTGWANGDFDGDGGVGGLDYTLWRTRPTAYPGTVGPHSGGGPETVPEPGTVILLSLGLPALAAAARRRRAA